MQKDFDKWNILKKETEAIDSRLFLYHEREIRWCRLGVNVGFEQDGTGKGYSRPVLVLKAFSRHVCLVIPLTTSQKPNKYHIDIGIVAGRRASLILSQIRLIDTKRLDQRLAILSTDIFEKIRKAVKDML